MSSYQVYFLIYEITLGYCSPNIKLFSGHPGSQGLHSDDFDFTDITEAIKNNNTGVELAKRVLSKLAKLTERSGDSNSLFMMWTIPTTILALMGIVYFVGRT